MALDKKQVLNMIKISVILFLLAIVAGIIYGILLSKATAGISIFLCPIVFGIAVTPFIVFIMVIWGIISAVKDKNNVQPPTQQYNQQYYNQYYRRR